MSLHKQIREHLLQLLSNEISLDEFDEWIAQNTWNIQRNPDLSAQRLAYAIELRLGEFDSGHLLEEQLRKELSNIASIYIEVPNSSPSTESSFSYSILSQPWSYRFVDMSPAKASE
jgi:hypothetical protein